MKRYLTICTFALLALLPSFMQAAIADPVPEYDMKAAYLYNFATLTSWPEHNGKQIRLCVLGKDSFKGSLEKLTSTQSNGVRISLTYLSNLKAIDHCQMLFIDASELANADDILQKLDNMPVLTVTDSADLFKSGVMICLAIENKRLTFDVNYAQTLNAGLSVSSKLLRVARKVLQ